MPREDGVKFNMSSWSISTTSFVLSCSSIGARIIISYSTMFKIVFAKSTSILRTFVINVSTTSTPTYTCSSLIVLGANAPSTFACTYYPPSFISKFLSFLKPYLPSTSLIVVCWLKASILYFDVFATTKEKVKKQNKYHHQHHLVHFLALETKKNPSLAMLL